MRKVYIYLMMLLATACYEDKGNYDYTSLQDLTIGLTYDTYERGIGSQLQIDPIVATDIDDSDLDWQWEIGTYSEEHDGYWNFVKFAEGRKLDYTCKLGGYFEAPGTYRLRLHARQKSSERSFYSPVVTLSLISQLSGLVVLHGNEQECDIALLKASDFLVNEGSVETSLNAHCYSDASGEKIPGKGISIIQANTNYLYNVDMAFVVAITDQTGVWASYADLSKGGDWNSMFLPGINKGNPQFYDVQEQHIYAVDDGQIFPRTNSFSLFPIPSEPLSAYDAGSRLFYTSGKVQGFFFDKLSRGFIVTTNTYGLAVFSSNAGDYVKSFPTTGAGAKFNIAGMNADLVYVDKGGVNEHFLAVMKDDAGEYFLAELAWNAATDDEVAYARYDVNTLPGVPDAKFWAFGDSQQTMCYYATADKVYRFTANPSLALASGELTTDNGEKIVFDGEITMMKVLKPAVTSGSLGVNYYNRNKILLVGVYKDGQGTLYSLKIKQATGNVESYTTYSGFDRIYDANIKGI